MPSHYRELLPAPARRSDSPRTSDGENEKSALEKRKGKLVKIACRVCQRRRVKCDGQRPGCSTCNKRGETCVYDFDAAADTTRYQALRNKHRELELYCNQIAEVLDFLRNRPRPEALAFLEQIRRGDSLEELQRSVKDETILAGISPPSSLERTVDEISTKDAHERINLPPLMVAIASVDMEREAYTQGPSPWGPRTPTGSANWLRQ
ncbi:uncharacterized protein PV09_03471 [Verruconis gallopava]|uniref:Zn(2)-C6 fungal-type domain-containing protein n=1 Tax=Verruconis gallopava TaxID=253628 RepID=A0A0D2B2T2_9PEZI|nr:uncharacterized protein PV09_03471 [Verruconis gallopava]KIW05599.1 hypothetical protein PV09_03471 [Verruconis gallopava]